MYRTHSCKFFHWHTSDVVKTNISMQNMTSRHSHDVLTHFDEVFEGNNFLLLIDLVHYFICIIVIPHFPLVKPFAFLFIAKKSFTRSLRSTLSYR
jgi:hypothetical protein